MEWTNGYTLLSEMGLTQRFSRSYGLLSARFGVSPVRLTVYWLLALFVLSTTLVVRGASARDPGSWFFDSHAGSIRKYSAVRQQQAERFISAAGDAPPYRKSTQNTNICVGIPSVARVGARYLEAAVGSLLAGLTQQERSGIHLTVFLPHTDPSVHPAYHEAWLSNLVDDILLYNLPKEELDYIKSLERDDVKHRTKGLYDWTYLMKACYETGSPYIALLEDDTVAMDGWYHRSMEGLRQAETKSALMKAATDFLYLRLFYTEEYLGWNSEFWPTYAFWSVLVIGGVAFLIYWLRSTFPGTKRYLTPYLSIAIAVGIVPWAVILTFAAGKVTVFPLPAGINEMNNFGCCAQGLVFPRHKAHDLIQWYESKRIGYADMLTEEYADKYGEQRWAITPSVLQHIGLKSSKPNEYGHGATPLRPASAIIWNYAFELFSPKALRIEHELAVLDSPESESPSGYRLNANLS